MPKVKSVKAQKDYPQFGIKKGDQHFVWAIKRQRGGIVRRSLTRPRPSQLTESPFFNPLYAAQEQFDDALAAASCMGDLAEAREDFKSALDEIREECEEKFNNMPDGLQQGDTGQLLEGRAQSIEELISELDAVDIPDYDEGDEAEVDADVINGVRDELAGLSYGGE